MPKSKPKGLGLTTDKQLSGVHPEIARNRWERNLPCNLKQMAVALGVSYSVARQLAQRPGFPMLKGLVFPQFYTAWLAKSFGLEPEAGQPTTPVQVAAAVQTQDSPTKRAAPEKPANKKIREIFKQAGIEM
jgi:hypothetical protein